MTVTLCDRCGRRTKNRVELLVPTDRENGKLQVNGVWFGNKGWVLCNNCVKEFNEWLAYPHSYIPDFIMEDSE